MKYTINSLVIILIFLSFLSASLLTAQEQDEVKINQDIKTMEKILDKLLHKDSFPQHFTPYNTKGIYIPEFGLIFHVQQNPFERIRVKILNNRLEYLEKFRPSSDTLITDDKKILEKIKEMRKKRRDEKEKQLQTEDDIIMLNSKDSEKNTDKSQEKIIENLKNDIFLFYKKYASSLRTLKENQAIAVIIDLNHRRHERMNNSFLASRISYRELNQYRIQKLTEQALKDKIAYNISQTQDDINTNIEIMNEILNENLNISPSFHRPLYNNGFYVHDLGVIFFLEMPEFVLKHPRYKMFFNKYIPTDHQQKDEKQSEEEEENLKSKISDLKDNVFTILATYGHTLQINPEEFIIMNIDIGDKIFDFSTENPSEITMKVKKQYLDGYYHGELSKNNLQKKFVITSYFP